MPAKHVLFRERKLANVQALSDSASQADSMLAQVNDVRPIAVFVLGIAALVSVGAVHAQAQASPTVMVTTTPTYGSIVSTPDGQTLYQWAGDKPGESYCSGSCASNWIPFAVDGDPVAPDGLPGTLGVIARDDGTRQITYNNWPLYTFAGDPAPGSTNGQGLTGFGGLWSVVGTAVTDQSQAPAATTSQQAASPAVPSGLAATPANSGAATPAYTSGQAASPATGSAGYGGSAGMMGAYGPASGASSPAAGSGYTMMGAGYGYPSGYPGSSAGYGYPMMGGMGYGGSMGGYGGGYPRMGMGYGGFMGGYGAPSGPGMMMRR